MRPRSSGSCRSSRAGPRTTRCWSASWVGKTAIVEGLPADHQGRGAELLKNRQIYTLDLALVAGSASRRVRGAAEEGDEGDHPARRHRAVHRRAPQPGRRGGRRGRDRRRLDPQAGAGPRRSRRSAPRRWTSTASTWNATRRSSAASSRSGSTNRRSRTRSPSSRPARALRGAPPGQDHGRRPAGRRRARRPLYLRPLPAGQGDRPDRRGSLADEDQVHVAAAGLSRPRGGDRETWRSKEAAIEAQEFEKAANLRDRGAPADEQEAGARGPWGAGGRRAPRGRRGGDCRHRLDVDRSPSSLPRPRPRSSCGWRTSAQAGDRQHVAITAVRRRSAARAGIRIQSGRRARSSPAPGVATELARTLAEFCSATRTRWSASTCPSTWRSTPSRARSARPRLRRLRRGRPAHRGGAPQAIFGAAARRDREGAPDAFNILLQILEDGRLTDAQGGR